jgi:DNA repair protein SbcD/Mre11
MKFLLTADWHIRDDVPVARKDNFYEAMERKIRFVFEIACKYDVEAILHAGDVFNVGRPVQSQMLEILMMDIIDEYKVRVLVIPGNHDLPYHSMKELGRSSLGVLIRGGYVENIHDKEEQFVDLEDHNKKWKVIGRGWGTDLKEDFDEEDNKIVLWHGMVLGKEWIPGGVKGNSILRKHPNVDLFVTGHNHEKFLSKNHEESLLVNPGGLLRMGADDVDEEPAVFIYDTQYRSLDHVLLPIEKDVFDLSYKEDREERDEKIASFVENMRNEYEVGLSFEDNLRNHLQENPVEDSVETMVWKAVETPAK